MDTSAHRGNSEVAYAHSCLVGFMGCWIELAIDVLLSSWDTNRLTQYALAIQL